MKSAIEINLDASLEADTARQRRRHFPRQVKLDVVRTLSSDREALERAAIRMNVPVSLARRWLSQVCAAAEESYVASVKPTSEQEMKKLRREVLRLQNERDLLIDCLCRSPYSAYQRRYET